LIAHFKKRLQALQLVLKLVDKSSIVFHSLWLYFLLSVKLQLGFEFVPVPTENIVCLSA